MNILKEQRKILLVEYEKIPKNDDKKMSELTNDLFKASLNVMVQMNQLKREIYLSKVSKETSLIHAAISKSTKIRSHQF